ncbi:glucosamine-6-phosphate deaminase [Thermoflavimicrobium dichotomicum]|nr:glucosamine-6-phosphate deaminase [Thermoflavimicrobium dichotomicum]
MVCDHYEEMSRQAAQIVARQIQQKPDSVIGFATGSTPLGLYQELVRMYHNKEVSFERIQTFNLDEYVGLAKDHPQSYYRFMWDHLFGQVGIQESQIHFPSGIFQDAKQACEEYEIQLQRIGAIDLQILGIGANGHIGFNEPSDVFVMGTHIVQLTERTIEANARFFQDKSEVPRQAITMGIGNIMKARHILLLANDESKAEAVQSLFSGVVDPRVPASILQLHPNVSVLVTSEVAYLLKDLPFTRNIG